MSENAKNTFVNDCTREARRAANMAGCTKVVVKMSMYADTVSMGSRTVIFDVANELDAIDKQIKMLKDRRKQLQ